ncbi:protein NRT1/ PTR FAMILY 4.5-like [Aristolochia californica]|uniref:protein NRT1/ PTR FAMILY 4.5-like n=1 Tax=Aristolochia californica TaxID=171875 RepID=UPI0035DE973A
MEGFIDWRGNPINKGKHGGRRAAAFIYVIVVMSNLAFVPTTTDMVGYLRETMHMDLAATSSTVTTFIGGTCLSALLGGCLSDSYINRFTTILIFGPIEFLGFCLLAIQAHLPSLQPPSCDISSPLGGCQHVDGYKALLLYVAMYTVALGEGCLRANFESFGADQFDDEDLGELHHKSSFFNWYGFCCLAGPLVGFTLTVWVANNVGWEYGFALSAGAMLLGLMTLVAGFSFYRYQRPIGSPLTRMLQVLVAAFRNRKLVLSDNGEELLLELVNKEEEGEMLAHTKGLKWLDKASFSQGNQSRWSSCSLSQVEETKIVLRMLPIFVCAVFGYMSIPQLITFTVQQGSTMDTKVGPVEIPTASLLLIPVVLQMILLIAYDRFFVPSARNITGYRSGITHLQRVGVGFVATSVAAFLAGIVEWKRKQIAEAHGIVEITESKVPMSVMWLGIQFLALGTTDAFMFVGLLEFFNSEVSRGMKSLGTAVFWCVIGLASFMGSLLVQLVNRQTGWLVGNNLNKNYLDRYYWLLAFIGTVAFLSYLYFAKRYVYRHNPHLLLA